MKTLAIITLILVMYLVHRKHSVQIWLFWYRLRIYIWKSGKKIFTISASRQHSLGVKWKSLLIYIIPNNLPKSEVCFIGSWFKKLAIQELRSVLKIIGTKWKREYLNQANCFQIQCLILQHCAVFHPPLLKTRGMKSQS